MVSVGNYSGDKWMSNVFVDNGWCCFLIIVIFVVGGVGVVGVVVFFIVFWNLSEWVKFVGVFVEVDISKFELG